MITKYPKLIMVVSLILCLVFGIWIGMTTKTIILQQEYSSQEPRRIVAITINESQQEELFRKLRKFADRQAYAILIAPTALGPKSFILQMWREDIKMIGANSYEPGKFQIGFYDTDRLYPAAESDLDDSISELKSIIGEIQNVTIVEEK